MVYELSDNVLRRRRIALLSFFALTSKAMKFYVIVLSLSNFMVSGSEAIFVPFSVVLCP